MHPSGERILIVENDPEISDLIARQALRPLGYAVAVIEDPAVALQRTLQEDPDLIVVDLDLPGLSGKDLLTALASQGVSAPLVVVARKGGEQGVIQAFRLGATDALFWPARDAEVVRVVERALQQTHEARARRQLGRQLDLTHMELERRLRDLTTLVGIGRAVISITDRRRLFDRILEGAQQLASADMSWLTVRDEKSGSYLLRAQRNLPAAWAARLGQPLDDGISSLVALSGESLTIHGAALEKFRVSALGRSAAVLPLKVQSEVVGLLVVVRQADREVEQNVQTLLESAADFASISLVNAQLFRALQQSTEAARAADRARHAMVESLREAIRAETQAAIYPLESVLSGQPGALTKEQTQALKIVQNSLKRLTRAAERTMPAEPPRLT